MTAFIGRRELATLIGGAGSVAASGGCASRRRFR